MANLYRHFDKEGKLLYVGISLSAIQRTIEHKRLSGWFSEVANITIETLPTREEALLMEEQAIKNEKPLYNIVHADLKRLSALVRAESIPDAPYIHPSGLLAIGKLQEEYKSGVAVIALYLISLMDKNTQNNTINVKQTKIVEELNISGRTIVSGLKLLIEHGFITKVGKTSYRLSAKLAWYGNKKSWAIALAKLKEDESL